MADVDITRGESVTVLASAARTATPDVDTFHVTGGETSGLVLIIDVTASAASPSVVFTIVGSDPLSGETWTILASAAITGVGTTILRVHPSLTADANLIADDIVPAYWTVTAAHDDADSITYSVAAQVI
jgi:hypothetical protein